jgi:hypothetical protein
MTVAEKERRKVDRLPQRRATRRSMRVEEMDKELVVALAATTFDHLDPKLNDLME